ncbi:MAG TPA: 5-formyltetrahydrofolate cyclo-ligase [Candidatus Avacidaminococcus intestinavium]|uniref:5-formyltetrahydrofolate cyclo-ligase n=1 Tax=Candidatus Avacidaminococcus intestinavium TaxID=2840684 RepID=A0A9D1SKZ7_9FIRM|nr:5-formyltetrahydrofolate cyclo-ligase [Candidatus Avacidaminococcus intestinavium]
MDKKQLRTTILTTRNNLDSNMQKTKSMLIINKILASKYFQQAKNIMLFSAFGSEVNLTPLLKIIVEQNKQAYLPFTDKISRKILPIKVRDVAQLVPGTYGILEPKAEGFDPQNYQDLELIITPGLIFDHSKNRIGYGAGYYDRLFPLLNVNVIKMGVCFEEQVLPKIPTEEHDIPLDLIITDQRLIK